MRRLHLPRRVFLIATLIAAATLATPAHAQDISINLGGGQGGVTERAIQLIALLTVLSIAPSILIMMTSFTRIVVVLSLLRTAMGTATAPPNSVIIALAMFLTAFVMGPVLTKSYDDGIKPLIANQITVEDALQRAVVPLRGFMQKNVREKDLKLFMDLSGEPPPATPEDMSLRILVPAFMISELKRAFEIGFLLVPALPDHRPRGRLGADVDGHDDAAAGRGVPALQADLLRAGRRLVAGRRQPGAELRRLARQTRFSGDHDMRLTTPRIMPAADNGLTEEQREIVAPMQARGPVLNIFRTLLNHPAAAKGFLGWGGYVLSRKNTLPPREREIVILRTGFLCRSGYEWTQHVPIGKRAGLTDDEIARIKLGADAPGWSEADARPAAGRRRSAPRSVRQRTGLGGAVATFRRTAAHGRGVHGRPVHPGLDDPEQLWRSARPGPDARSRPEGVLR